MVLANGITGEGFLLIGLGFFLLPLAVVSLIEWTVFRILFRVRLRLATVSAANVLSAVACLPLAYLMLARPHLFIRNTDLGHWFAAAFWYTLARYAAYFLASIILEGLVEVVAAKKAGLPLRRVVVGCIVGNLLSYAIISPVYYFASGRPTHDGATFTPDAPWAQDCHENIVYIESPSGHLVQCEPSGQHTKTLVPHRLDGYLLWPDLSAALFRDGPNLYHTKAGRVTLISAKLTDPRSGAPMNPVELNPAHDRVAYLADCGRKDPYTAIVEPHLYDLNTGVDTPLPIQHEYDCREPGPTWNPAGTHLRFANKQIDLSSRAITDAKDSGEFALSDLYEPISPNCYRPVLYQNNYIDTQDNVELATWNALSSNYATITRGGTWSDRNGTRTFHLNPNLHIVPVFDSHEFGDFAFIPNSSLAILEDASVKGLYVVDTKTGLIAKIANGSSPVLLRDRYRRDKTDLGTGFAKRR